MREDGDAVYPDGWFRDADPDDPETGAAIIRSGRGTEPGDWPTLAVEAGFAPDESAYYTALQAATREATRAGVDEAGQAGDRQLVHAVRALDDTRRIANELAERVTEWGVDRYGFDLAGIEAAQAIVERDVDTPDDERLRKLAAQVVALDDEEDALRGYVERRAPGVAPNLAAMAGPVLAARLIALAGGLESLAKLPSGTVQVLGAEDALFAHLRGDAPSPKHGVIYTHEYVRGTRPADRGSAARAVAGKLSIAARVDHYSGDRRPELDAELDDRIARIRARDSEGSIDE